MNKATENDEMSGSRAAVSNELRTLEVKKEDVKQLLTQCDDAVVREMFDMGKILVDGMEKRMDDTVARGTTLIGFTGAMLAFLLTGNVHVHGAVPKTLIGLGGLLAAGACVTAFIAGRITAGWNEMSEPIWFHEVDARNGHSALLRYYVRALHVIHRGNRKIIDDKAADLGKAQLMAAAAAVCLAAALVAAALS